VFERFTDRARQAVAFAQEEARALDHDYIGTEHLLLGLAREHEGVAAQVLESLGVTLERARAQVLQLVGRGDGAGSKQVPFSPRAKRALELALRETLGCGQSYIDTEHMLLGLVGEHEGAAARILVALDAEADRIRSAVIIHAGAGVPPLQQRGEVTEPPIDPAWLDGLAAVLKPLGGEIRSGLRRPPDVGDLLLAVACVPHTPAAEALRELGLDVDRLQGEIERARLRQRAEQEALTQRLTAAVQARELAVGEGRLGDATRWADLERELRQQAQAQQHARLDAIGELRRRLALAPRSDDR
jgi:ClpA/ClpB-like protein